MIIDAISDLHGFYPKLLGGDMLIVAGDVTATDTRQQHARFKLWFENQDYKYKILIAGNHDGYFMEHKPVFVTEGIHYLCDSGVEIEGLKIWGSPWTPEFCGWDWMLPRGEAIAAKWALIPNDTDILITHGPPHGILDECPIHMGCADLRKRIEKVKPRLHVFGHIHEGYGEHIQKHIGTDTHCVNSAHVNRQYQPVNQPIRVILCKQMT